MCAEVYLGPRWISALELLWNVLHTSSLYCRLWTILAHCYDAFIAYCFSYSLFHFQLFRIKNVTMRIEHAKVTLLYSHCWWQRFSLSMNNQFCCEIMQLWWKKFIKLIKNQIELDKIFYERNMYVFFIKLRQVILISSFRIVNLLWCGGNIMNTTIMQKSLSFGRFLAL